MSMQLLINSVNIIDYKNKQARKISFSSKLNIITSKETSRGKSSIIRAIYHAFGANAAYDNVFEAHDKVFIVEFTIKNVYKIVRFKNTYIIYKDNEIVLKTRNNYKELSKFYENEFNYSIYLTDKQNNFDIAPVAYLFIPYFLDQDKSWKNEIIPFLNTEQFTDDQLINLYYYHLGALDTNFYDYNRQLLKINREIKDYNDTIKRYKDELIKLKKVYDIQGTSTDEASVQSNILIMKAELEKKLLVKKDAEKLLFGAENDLVNLENQIKSIDKLLLEQKKSLDKMENKKKEYIKYCNNCGAEIDLTQFDDYQINYNSEFLKEKKKSLIYDKTILNDKLSIYRIDYKEKSEQVQELSRKYNDSNNLFEKYVRAKAVSIIIKEQEQRLFDLYNKINKITYESEGLKANISQYDKKKREVNRAFVDTYYQELLKLEVVRVNRGSIKNFKKYVLSGSQYVRSTLAFFITYLKLKEKFNPNMYNFPLLIDSPFEGDQDGDNRGQIVSSIMDYYNGQQLIIGIRDARQYFDKYPDVEKKYIDLMNDKGFVLLDKEFEDNKEYINSIASLIIN